MPQAAVASGRAAVKRSVCEESMESGSDTSMSILQCHQSAELIRRLLPGNRIQHQLAAGAPEVRAPPRQPGLGPRGAHRTAGVRESCVQLRPVWLIASIRRQATAAVQRSGICASAARSADRPTASVPARIPEARRTLCIACGRQFLSPMWIRRPHKRRGTLGRSGRRFS